MILVYAQYNIGIKKKLKIMKKMIVHVALIIVTSVSVFAQMPSQKSDKTDKIKAQVMALATEWANAKVKGDTATLERILSDDFSEIYDLPASKKLLIDSFKLNANNPDIRKLTAIDFDTSLDSIRLYDNVAVMIFPAKVKWSGGKKGQPGEGNFMHTLVAYKKKGQWQIVVIHYSEYKIQVTPSQ
jgi:hypothetical protein